MNAEELLEQLVELDVPQDGAMRDVTVRMVASLLVDGAKEAGFEVPLGVSQNLLDLLEDERKVRFVVDVLLAALKEV